MERETPFTHGSPGAAVTPGAGVVAVAVDADAASQLASSLRRPGHVVVTAPFSTTAARLFALATPRLGRARVVPFSARLLVESEVARAITGVTARGLPPPSPADLAAFVEEARHSGARIVLLVEDADALQADRLERISAMLARTEAMREVVRLVLLGSGPLLHTLQAPEAARFVEAIVLHLNVSAPAPVTLAQPARSEALRRTRRREAGPFLNEKLLVLAVGAVLVTGVLLFPIEPTVYPPPARDAAPATPKQAVAAAPEAAPSLQAAATGRPSEDATPAAAEEAGGPPPDAVEAGAAAPQDARRFRPPARPGPALQVGAFRDPENAMHVAERLVADFPGVYIDQLGEGDASLHRVRVPIPDGVLGERTLAQALSERGYAPVHVE